MTESASEQTIFYDTPDVTDSVILPEAVPVPEANESAETLGAAMVAATTTTPEEAYKPAFVRRDNFDAYADSRGMSRHHAARAWRTGEMILADRYTAEHGPFLGNQYPPASSLNLDDILATLRCIEAGDVAMDEYGFGGNYWNLYATIINDAMVEDAEIDAPLVLNWQEDIHKRLGSHTSDIEKSEAVAELEHRYRTSDLVGKIRRAKSIAKATAQAASNKN